MNSPKGKMFRVTMTTQPWEILCELQAPIARYLVAEPNLLPAARPPAANTRAPPELRLPRLSQEAQPPSVVMQVPPLPILRLPLLSQENSPHRRSCRRPRCRSCVSPSCHRRRSTHWQPPSAVMQVPPLPVLRFPRLPQENSPHRRSCRCPRCRSCVSAACHRRRGPHLRSCRCARCQFLRCRLSWMPPQPAVPLVQMNACRSKARLNPAGLSSPDFCRELLPPMLPDLSPRERLWLLPGRGWLRLQHDGNFYTTISICVAPCTMHSWCQRTLRQIACGCAVVSFPALERASHALDTCMNLNISSTCPVRPGRLSATVCCCDANPPARANWACDDDVTTRHPQALGRLGRTAWSSAALARH